MWVREGQGHAGPKYFGIELSLDKPII